MATRVIVSDSEDEENVPIRTIRPSKTNRLIYSDEESFTEESDVSSIVYLGPEEELNKTHTPLQVNNKMTPVQRVVVSDDEEQTDATTSSSVSASSRDSRDSYYSEPERDLDDSYSPVHTNHRKTRKKRVIDSDQDTDNEDETDTARTYVPSSLPIEETPKTSNKGAINTAVRKETLEKDKENKSPDPQPPSAPADKPLLLSQLGPVSRPIVQPLKVPPVVTTVPHRPMNDTFSVAHTRPALLKQLEYVKRLRATIGANLPDKGASLVQWEHKIMEKISSIKGGDETLMMFNQQQKLNTAGASADNGAQQRGGLWGKNRILAQQYKCLTNNAVEQLHSAMQSCPAPDSEVEDPETLQTPLMPHQRRALAWALWRETQVPSGGILADDMGLGKTLTMLSLILAAREKTDTLDSPGKLGPTLVVCPASLMRQWESEISTHVRAGELTVQIYHSDHRLHDPRRLAQFDVVITTYGIVGSEGAAFLPDDSSKAKPKRKASHHTLFEIQWNRIILDEGHTIKNPKANVSIGVCGLSSDHRWVLSGTPLHNSLKDMYSLVKFLKLAPFNELTVWKELVQKTEMGMRRLQTLIQSLLLRRTKQDIGGDGQPIVKLPNKEIITHCVSLNEDEQTVFDLLFVQCRSKFLDYLQDLKTSATGGSSKAIVPVPDMPPHLAGLPSIMAKMFQSINNNNAVVLVTILRLLQCSCHLGLLGRAMDVDQKETDQLEVQFSSMSLNSATGSGGISRSWAPQEKLPECFSMERRSSKVQALLEQLTSVLKESSPDKRSPKCVLVSQWSSFLDIIEKHVCKVGFTFVRIDGNVPPKKRNSLVEEFNSRRAHPQLLLMTLKTGGVGLNLTRGSHLFLMDLHWNPALEQQATDRIHRMGQTSDVVIHKFLCTKTAEEKVVQIQESKKQLASDVLACAAGMDIKNRLTLADLKLLFSI